MEEYPLEDASKDDLSVDGHCSTTSGFTLEAHGKKGLHFRSAHQGVMKAAPMTLTWAMNPNNPIMRSRASHSNFVGTTT